MEAKLYRKKPVLIEAMILTRENVDAVARWCGGRVIREEKASDPTDVYVALDIPTLEGTMRAQTVDPSGRYPHGDAVIRGVQGEFYPCKPDIFADTYDVVTE
ncbi:hypothetical protein [Leucobacter sp.]